jgi:hypothetical protein
MTHRAVSQYPFLAKVQANRVDMGRMSEWANVLCSSKRMSDTLVEISGTDQDMLVMMYVMLSYYQQTDYVTMDVFELCDIVYMRHPRFDSFWKINQQVIMLYTAFNKYSTTSPGRLADWVCQLWDKARMHRQSLVLFAWTAEACESDLALWRDYAERRSIRRVRLGGAASKPSRMYVK